MRCELHGRGLRYRYRLLPGILVAAWGTASPHFVVYMIYVFYFAYGIYGIGTHFSTSLVDKIITECAALPEFVADTNGPSARHITNAKVACRVPTVPGVEL